jgi:DNA-binding response OmpR family regulator
MNKKILIVDDCPDSYLMMQVILELNNFDVDIANSAVLGLQKIMNNPPDAVIMNHMMPYMDGCQFLRCIRTLNGYDYLPVLMVSCLDEAYVIAKSEYNFNGFIQKPIAINNFVDIVNKILNFNDEVKPALAINYST